MWMIFPMSDVDDDVCRDDGIAPTYTLFFAKMWFLSLKFQYIPNHFLFKETLQM